MPSRAWATLYNSWRYIPLVQERGGKVLFECQPALAGLLTDLDGVDELVVQGKPLPPYDVQVPLLSLPAVFGTTLATVPAPIPYLRADPARVEYWKKELATLGGFKVGIAWQGNPKNPVDRYRSLPLAQFETLAHMAGVALLSLQVGPGMDQLATATFPITDLGKRLDPNCLGDLATMLKNVDLVITVDTAVAHVAGAWAYASGTCCHWFRTGAGCGSRRIAPGIPACAYFVKAGSEIGAPCWNGSRKKYIC